MDAYLNCLYQHISEHIETDARLNLKDYRRWNAAQDMAWSALERALTLEQLKLVEDYRSAWCGLRALEDELLFQSAVDLGKWMVLA